MDNLDSKVRWRTWAYRPLFPPGTGRCHDWHDPIGRPAPSAGSRHNNRNNYNRNLGHLLIDEPHFHLRWSKSTLPLSHSGTDDGRNNYTSPATHHFQTPFREAGSETIIDCTNGLSGGRETSVLPPHPPLRGIVGEEGLSSEVSVQSLHVPDPSARRKKAHPCRDDPRSSWTPGRSTDRRGLSLPGPQSSET